MNRGADPIAAGLRGRDYALAGAVFLLVAGFHFFNGQRLAGTVLLQSFNWLFDFDASRFVAGWCVPGADVARELPLSFVARHALSLAVRPVCLGLTAITGDAQQALLALTALCAGCAAAIAYFLAAQFCAGCADRTLLALGFAVSTQPLMLGVIPESYGFALAGIGLHMVMVARQRALPPAAGAAAVITFMFNAGVTVTNAVLNLVSAAALAWRRVTPGKWLATELRTWVLAAIALLLVVVPLGALFTPTLLAGAGAAPKEVWWIININRGEPAGLARVIAALVPYSFVAPEFTLVDLKQDGHPMLDFREFRFGIAGAAALALWFAAMTAGVLFAWRDDALRRVLAIVCCWTLLNVLLHWYWQYRGSIYLYGAHTSFPLFALLVIGYAGAMRRFAPVLVRAMAMLMLSLAAFNNIGLYTEMIEFVVAQPAVQLQPGAPRPNS